MSGINNILLLGDLNMPEVNWDAMSSDNATYNQMCKTLDKFNLSQLNYNPSRHSCANILDVILSNKPLCISDVKCTVSIINSDHFELNFCLDESYTVSNNSGRNRIVYNFSDINWDELDYYIKDLNLEELLFNYDDVNLAWYTWKSKILEVINKLVPSKVCKNKKGSPWIDGEVIHLSNVKHNLWKKANNSNRQCDWDNYKRASNTLKNTVTRKFNEFINEACDDIASNPKRFWGLVSNKARSSKQGIPDDIHYDNNHATEPLKQAELFNTYFFSQFNGSQFVLPTIQPFVNNNLCNINVNVNDVYKVLIKLNVNKAQGADGIPTIIYRNLASTLAPSMTMLFNLSLLSGTVPDEWKWANVVPIFKKGAKNDVTNYRPISLLPVIGKILEKCIHDQIYSVLVNDININQHGFMHHRSTATQLIDFYHNVYSNIDHNKQVDIVYLDFSKAFDCIPHSLLIHKLTSMGFSGNILAWLNNYLSNRRQRVVLKGACSSYLHVRSGVPQGSILGPLLFILYINDIFSCVNDESVNLALYADDSKISKIVQSEDDCEVLQGALNTLVQWSTKWGMQFNNKKCEVMSFKLSKHKTIYNYCIDNHVLKRSSQFTDLGVIVSDDMSCRAHIDNCINKANKRLGLVKRCIGYNCSVKTKLLSYTALVRPLLEYNTVTWFPDNRKYVSRLESVQRRATKFILSDYKISYKDRLNACNLLPLSLRRQYLDGVFVYNSLNNINAININKFLEFLGGYRPATRLLLAQDDLMFSPIRANHDIFNKYFTRRIVALWNNIPYNIRSLDLTVNDNNTPFKRELKSWLWKYFTKNFNSDNICTWIVACNCNVCRLV
jgi:hypothetical protein